MDSPSPSRTRRSLRALGRFGVTLTILAVAGTVLVGGRTLLAERAAARPAPEPAPAATVELTRIEMQDSHAVIRRFSGQVEARQQVDLAFERAGTIAEVLVREGDRVAEGQPIARLDLRLLRAERARLEAQRDALMAQVELARRTNERQEALRERGFATDQRMDDTSLGLTRLKAEIAGIDAGLMVVDVNLSKSELTAPFAGTVGARAVDAGAVAAPGLPVVTLLQAGTPRFRVGLAPALAQGLAPGDRATVTLDGIARPATLAQLSPDLEPVTRSRIAFFDLEGAPPPARSTGQLELVQQVAGRGAWVPLSALRAGPRGSWTLLSVVDDEIVVEAAEIVHLTGTRAFVRGTFRDGAPFLAGGTHRVVPGQRVTGSEAVAWAR